MKPKRPHGTLRRSQILTTYGPGAMVDLPDHAVIIGGLEHWSDRDWQVVHEPRLLRRLRRERMRPTELRMPPAASDAHDAGHNGITAWMFPEWFVGAPVEGSDPGARSRPLISRRAVERGKYQNKPVVPVRFVQACTRGHISDIDWYTFVHRGKTECRGDLFVDERGTTGDLHNVVVRCSCGQSRPMSAADGKRTRGTEVIVDRPEVEDAPLGYCKGERPWLGSDPRWRQHCGGQGQAEPNRLLIRSASNTWFADTVSVISIPDREADLDRWLDEAWTLLKDVENLEALRFARANFSAVRKALDGRSDSEVWDAVQRRRSGNEAGEEESLKRAELRTLLAAGEDLTDNPDLPFSAQRLSGALSVPGLERVVLVHRLREVMALLGFTRFEPPIPDEEGEISLGVHRADLASTADWVPAVENRGEGVFLGFDEQRIRDWLVRPAVERRWQELRAGQDRWRQRHRKTEAQHPLPGPEYIMLHTLSHLLITTVALESGYSSSAIRERIYAVPGVGYGVLLYTATSDSEGTLGGLVQVGRQIERHLQIALERGRLCSHDPVCAEHMPANDAEERYLHGAACHGCVLISETSCEQRNVLLDRALVVETVGCRGASFHS
ncbi:MAG TPA: DUF1998 domain-containing protein [Myxococcota bacterium]|nr:DUF1998 domain-containing protein [Myxococcota bacterium]